MVMVMKKKKKQKIKDREKSLLKKILEMEKSQRLKEDKDMHFLEKSTMNKRLIYVMILFIVLFLTIVLYLVYFQLFRSESVADNSHNKRLWINENVIKRGNIYDRNGNILVYSQKDENGNSQRIYTNPLVDSTFTGYNSVQYGKSGLEKTYNKELLDISDQSKSKIRDLVEQSGIGNDLNITIDQRIQDIAYDILGDYTGSIVVMDPRDGEVLAMISKPSYNPNTIENDWENLVQSNNAPLLNRASQGVYRPGSTMKIVTTTAILDSEIDTSFNDTGKVTIQGYNIENFGGYTYGSLNLRSAFLNSVNTYFASKTDQLGKDYFKEISEKYMFNKNYKFDLEKINSKIPFDGLNQVDLAMTGFGYGKTQVTPLHMAMIASAIANGGKMMQPRLVRNVVDKDGKIVKKSSSEVLAQVTSEENANTIRDFMVDVVNRGTGTAAYINATQIAGKTGTADKNNGATDAWFVGFAPAYDPKLAFAIVLEDSNGTGGDSAAPLAGQLVNSIVNNIDLE